MTRGEVSIRKVRGRYVVTTAHGRLEETHSLQWALYRYLCAGGTASRVIVNAATIAADRRYGS